MKKAVYIWIAISIFAAATLANERVEIKSVSSPEYVVKGEIFTLSAKVIRPQTDESLQLYLHTNFDVSLKSVELNGVDLHKQLRFYRVDVNTDYDKVYKIESGQIDDSPDRLFQVNFQLSSSSDNPVKLFVSDAENFYDESERNNQIRNISIYDASTNAGKSLQLGENSEVNFKISADENESEKLLVEFWAKLNDGHSKFLTIKNDLGEELTSVSISEFGYLSIPDILDAEFYDELYVDQNNWNYFLAELNTSSGKMKVYLNDDLFYKGICSKLTNQTNLNLALINSSTNKPLFDRLKIWSYNNTDKLALLNKNFNAYSADSSKILFQNNFDSDNSLSEIKYKGQVRLEKSDAPLFSRAPNLNVVLYGQSYSLSWQINELSNARKFVIEKSYDAGNYFEVSSVQVVDESKKLYNLTDYDYTDNQIIYYRIKQVNQDNSEIYSSNVKVGRGEVKHFTMQQNYPNPFNPITTVTVEVKQAEEFEIVVYDIVGKTIKKLHDGPLSEGVHRFNFDGTDLPSGLYLCEVKSGDELEVMKMILAK